MNKNNDQFVVFYRQSDNQYNTLKSNRKTQQRPKVYPILSKKFNCFEVMKGYSASDEGLKEYMKDLQKWMTELSTNTIHPIDYHYYVNHRQAAYCFFLKFSKRHIKDFEHVYHDESKWMESCYNAGNRYLRSPGLYKCYGYDYISYYPECQTMIKIPKRAGRSIRLSKLHKNLEYGMYRVQIKSEDERVKMLFQFSKNNTYTHFSIQYARFLKDQGFDLSIKLIQDEEDNAYIYDQGDLVSGRKLFFKWYKTLLQLKAKFPKNRLIKSLGSTLWGRLIQFNRKTVSEVEMKDIDDKNDYDIDDIRLGKNLNMTFVLKPKSGQMYKTELARIKPFVTSFGVQRIGRELIKNDVDLNHVVRIQTDGVILMDKYNFDDSSLVVDPKTTGKIKFKHFDSYFNISMNKQVGR